jgi:hypothetical protein
MFNWLTPLTSILAEHHASPVYKAGGAKAAPSPRKPLLHTFLHAPPPVLLELVQAVADDVSTCSKLGLFGRRTGERAGRFADWCWFASTLVDLVENSVELGLISNSKRTGELNRLASWWNRSQVNSENSRVASLRRVHGRSHSKVHSPENQGGRQRAEAVAKAGVLASGAAHKVAHGFDIRL